MFAIELSVLLALGGAAALASLVHSVHTALPQIAGIRQALAECPAQHELRFTIREVIVHYNDGKVVPLRQRQAISLPRPLPVRAAA